LGIDDTARIDAHVKDLVDLGLGGAVKAVTQSSQELQDLGVGVAFNSIKGLDTRKIHFPTQMLAVNLAQVGHEEGVFLSGLAKVMVNALNSLTEGIANQLPRQQFVVVAVAVESMILRLFKKRARYLLGINRTINILWRWSQWVDERECHDHILCGDWVS
jgi:hypothetical protein